MIQQAWHRLLQMSRRRRSNFCDRLIDNKAVRNLQNQIRPSFLFAFPLFRLDVPGLQFANQPLPVGLKIFQRQVLIQRFNVLLPNINEAIQLLNTILGSYPGGKLFVGRLRESFFELLFLFRKPLKFVFDSVRKLRDGLFVVATQEGFAIEDFLGKFLKRFLFLQVNVWQFGV
ncbi:MAG: hypothetical protein ABJ015_07030 [Rhodopirellula bahusiensis]